VKRISLVLGLSVVAAVLATGQAHAQQMPSLDGRQFPLNQMTPPGTYAQWAKKVGKTTPDYLQPIRVTVPTTGMVTFYEGFTDRRVDLPAPAQASLLVGRMYRLKVSDLPEFPGVDFYPSIEVIDRLHPPTGKAEEFPVVFEFTAEEFEWAAQGRLVTKVVYLEQPNRVPTTTLDAPIRVKTIEPSQNVIAEADSLGRPMAIVRMGGRTPDPNQPEPAFFGPGGPIRIAQPASSSTQQVRRSGKPANGSAQAGVVSLGSKSTKRIAQR